MNESSLTSKRPKGRRIIGIDYGQARIGVAVSDELKMIASPFATVKTEKKMERTAAKLIKELVNYQEANQCEIEEIVVGLPLQMNGKMGLVADEVKHFVEILKTCISCPIVPWDERLTTVQADRAMRESSMTRKRRAQSVDVVTATIILQSYLDCKSMKN